MYTSYRQQNGSLTMEVVSQLPDAAFLESNKIEKPFSGKIIVEDWNGSFIKAYRFADNQILKAKSVSYSKGGNQAQSIEGAIVVDSWTTHCETTEYYYYTDYQDPTYNGSETHCWYEYTGEPDLLKATDYDENTNGGGGGGGGGTSSPSVNTTEVEAVRGDKPIIEYDDKCTGIQGIWDNYPNNEVAGYITLDGKLIVIDILSLTGGSTSGTYYHNGVTYYPYPASQGAPTNNYLGMLEQAGYYFIPVVASIHTHTPCRTDGTNGVSYPVGEDDRTRANAAPTISHWVIGCGAIAQYNGTNSNFYNIQAGNISSSCSNIN